MILIKHRVNTIVELKNLPTQYGVEIDIRSNNGNLILHHEPFECGESFEKWLAEFSHAFIILNVKEEGLEKSVFDLLEKYVIKNYFFLDQSFPFLIKSVHEGFFDSAVRFSEYESIETVFSLTGKIKWVWVDCFTHYPLTSENTKKLYEAGFHICLVSPELQGRSSLEDMNKAIAYIKDKGIKLDAVCTKKPTIWESAFCL